MELPYSLLKLIPHRALSGIVGRLSKKPAGRITRLLMRWYTRRYHVNLEEALPNDLSKFANFNAFFTRALKPGVRSWPKNTVHCASPVDGYIAQIGSLDRNQLLQAKGQTYTFEKLVGTTSGAKAFDGGSFATLYLAPGNYHRVHAPFSGQLQCVRYIPGRLYPVRPGAADRVPELFARNERIVLHFSTAAGHMILVMVGAFLVGGLETTALGAFDPAPYELQEWRFDHGDEIAYIRGEEIGRFNLGSTVILLFEKERVDWLAERETGQSIRLGQTLGILRSQVN